MTGRRQEERHLLRRALRESAGYRAHMLGILGLELAATPLFLLTPVPLAIVVDSVLGRKTLPGFVDAVVPDAVNGARLLLLAAAMQVLIALLADAQVLAAQVLRTYTAEHLTLAFRTRLFSHIQRLSFAFHDRRGTADSLYRIQYDTPSLSGILIDGVIPIVAAVATLVSVFWVILGINTQLTLVALAVVPPLALLTSGFRRRMRSQYRQSKRLDSSAMGVVHEVLGSFRVVKAFGREQAEQDRFVTHGQRSLRAKVRITASEGLLSLLVNAVTAIGTGAVLFVGIRQVQDGSLTLGALLVVLSYLSRLYAPVKTITKKMSSLQNGLASAQRGFELLDEEADVKERPDAVPLPRARGHIEFRDVRFAYEGGQNVLSGISHVAPAGSKVGLAGRTGAGKSTLVGLLMRFYDVTDGRVLLDGVDVRDYRLSDLRRQFAIVLQEPVLFSTSIRENIAYGRPDATFEDVQAAAVAAGAHDFVTALPDGYETLVGERGMRLSGGERQRISLARAFLKNAPILVLDEPTSSVDVHTEAEIMQALRRLMTGRTTFLIAHRLSTLDVCDETFELRDGRLLPRRTGQDAATAEVAAS